MTRRGWKIGILLAGVLLVGGLMRAGAQTPPPDYGTFSHTSATHAGMACEECHARENDDVSPRFPPHSACVACHITEFTDKSLTTCVICHRDLALVQNEDGDPMAPLNAFADRKSFGTRFDGRVGGVAVNQHQFHAAHHRPGDKKLDCAFCHDSQGTTRGFPGHPQCYECHSPTAESTASAVSSCSTCHPPASQSAPRELRPLASYEHSAAYKYRFSHSNHARFQCSSCHTISGAMMPGSPRIKQHDVSPGGRSCFACHNGKVAFGDETGENACAKCHGTTSLGM